MKEPIWKRVAACAKELTKNGNTPFTRQDLIGCVQRNDPRCGADTINPIIQGLTDNLRGGTPGAVGKDLLHSVGRGLFVLSHSEVQQSDEQGIRVDYKSGNSVELRISPPPETSQDGASKETSVTSVGGYEFRFICSINPERNDDDTLKEFMPQSRYLESDGARLNRYGHGPFCKFAIPANIVRSGVYALILGNEVRYVGECKSLSARFNLGYGNISPRNCFRGGQETNCRINSLVLEHIKKGQSVVLWFHETRDYKRVELELRASQRFSWNRA